MKSNKNSNSEPAIIGIVTVNDKGQIVIPAGARFVANIRTGDKLLVMMHPSKEGIFLMKPDGVEAFARHMLEQVSDARDSIRRGDDSNE
jgi:AbrB family looped-hinge helix DNA binding protein